MNRFVSILVGPLSFFLCYFSLPESVFGSVAANGAVGCVLWMALWWLLVPVDLAVTALVPISVNALFSLMDMKGLISCYASETILLLLGASIITASWEITGLDKRVAAKLLSFIGGNLRSQLVVWFLLSTVLSSILPNAVVCAAIIPIAVSMLKYVNIANIARSREGSLILLSIVYGAGIGGLATPLGGAMNLVTVNYIEQYTNQEYMFTDWVVKLLPAVIVLSVINILYFMFIVKKSDSIGDTKEYFKEQIKKFEKISNKEKYAFILFVSATVLSFTRQLYEDYLPGLKPAYVFITFAIIAFIISTKGGERLLTWKNTQQKIVWELMYVFAGGIALGALVNSTGAANAIALHVKSFMIDSDYLLIIVILIFTIVMSDITSNTATASVAVPLVVAIAKGMGKDPVACIYVAAIGINISYMLPTSIRAIPVGYGLAPGYMLKIGFPITVLTIVLMSFLSFIFI